MESSFKCTMTIGRCVQTCKILRSYRTSTVSLVLLSTIGIEPDFISM